MGFFSPQSVASKLISNDFSGLLKFMLMAHKSEKFKILNPRWLILFFS